MFQYQPHAPASCVCVSLTHHSSSVSLHKLDDASRVFVPQVDVSAVAAADHELAARPVEVHPLHCKEDQSVSQSPLQRKQSQSIKSNEQ